MKFPIFGGKDRNIQKSQSQDQAERLLVESFRTLSSICIRFADFIETQRLSRQGYEDQGQFLERLEADKKKRSGTPGSGT